MARAADQRGGSGGVRLPFLLEIGTEEIPDWMIAPAINQLQNLFQEFLDGSLLQGKVNRAEATPRRLVLRADGILQKQPDSEEVVVGPPKKAGKQAAESFARKNSTTVDQLATQTTAKGEYFTYNRKTPGVTASELIASQLPSLVLKIQWPKTMYWTGKGGPRFIRPIRWIVALLGEQVVPFEIAAVRSGDITRGHRRLGKTTIPITIADYDQALEDNFVILSADVRRKRIEDGIRGLTDGTGLEVKTDPDLLQTLIHITEYPTPILGCFDRRYLSLPEEVLVTVMRHHQKYFSVVNSDSSLAPNFIAVMNTNADPEGLVRKGNERVLRARFNDARFFYGVDQQKTLADRVPDLANVTFQAKLGSYLQKTERVVALAGALADELRGDKSAVERAALLSKADLTTEMVKEFTELQGVVGGLYAKAQGESEEVWKAIYDHYKPAGMEEPIASTLAGRIVSLADKLDTLKGCFAIGMIPTGSKDPFALRRAAQGVVKIIVEGGLRLSIVELLGEDAALRDFTLDRVRYYFREIRGFKYDEVNAVLASGWDDLVDVEARLKALQSVRPTENFEPLAASFKRIANILKQAEFEAPADASVEAALLEPGPERELFDDFDRLRDAARTTEYVPALEAIASIRPSVDLFFDKVLVNAPDPQVRRNRLTMLQQLLTEFSTIADFSEIVTQ
jgi:glycyl-tRNA synthetase beta chain